MPPDIAVQLQVRSRSVVDARKHLAMGVDLMTAHNCAYSLMMQTLTKQPATSRSNISCLPDWRQEDSLLCTVTARKY